jgi:hypothetical protein
MMPLITDEGLKAAQPTAKETLLLTSWSLGAGLVLSQTIVFISGLWNGWTILLTVIGLTGLAALPFWRRRRRSRMAKLRANIIRRPNVGVSVAFTVKDSHEETLPDGRKIEVIDEAEFHSVSLVRDPPDPHCRIKRV